MKCQWIIDGFNFWIVIRLATDNWWVNRNIEKINKKNPIKLQSDLAFAIIHQIEIQRADQIHPFHFIISYHFVPVDSRAVSYWHNLTIIMAFTKQTATALFAQPNRCFPNPLQSVSPFGATSPRAFVCAHRVLATRSVARFIPVPGLDGIFDDHLKQQGCNMVHQRHYCRRTHTLGCDYREECVHYGTCVDARTICSPAAVLIGYACPLKWTNLLDKPLDAKLWALGVGSAKLKCSWWTCGPRSMFESCVHNLSGPFHEVRIKLFGSTI